MSLNHQGTRARESACAIGGQLVLHVAAILDGNDRFAGRIVDTQPICNPDSGSAELLAIGLGGLNGLHGLL
jgi:hypothetical protein